MDIYFCYILGEWLTIGGVRINVEPPKHPELVPRLYGGLFVWLLEYVYGTCICVYCIVWMVSIAHTFCDTQQFFMLLLMLLNSYVELHVDQ